MFKLEYEEKKKKVRKSRQKKRGKRQFITRKVTNESKNVLVTKTKQVRKIVSSNQLLLVLVCKDVKLFHEDLDTNLTSEVVSLL